MISKAFGAFSLLVLAIADTSPASAQQVCNFLYAPVCGVSSFGLRMTYSNACWARLAGAKVLHPGECQGPLCTRIYKPVCAIPPGTHRLKTYANLCEAEVADAVWVYNGRCHK